MSQAEAVRESAFMEQSLNDKDDIIADLKQQLMQLDKSNVQLECRIKAVEEKAKRQKEELESEKRELEEEVGELQDMRKTNTKLPAPKENKEEIEWKKKAEILEKQLEKKEEMIRKMTEIRK